jgi:hypothetical protein
MLPAVTIFPIRLTSITTPRVGKTQSSVGVKGMAVIIELLSIGFGTSMGLLGGNKKHPCKEKTSNILTHSASRGNTGAEVITVHNVQSLKKGDNVFGCSRRYSHCTD